MLVGQASRVGYKVPPPQLLNVGGQPVVELLRRFVERTIGSVFGLPVSQAAWTIIYDIPAQPADLPVLPNPVYLTPGDDAGGTSTLHTAPGL
jgi:hypothetical protein